MRLYEFTNQTVDEMLSEIDRQGFLKGLGAAAATASIGNAKAGILPKQYKVRGEHGVEARVIAWSEKGAIEKAQKDPKFRNELFKNATAELVSDTELGKEKLNRDSALNSQSPEEIRNKVYKLKSGMPDFEVRSLLGPPTDKKLSTVQGKEQEHEIQNWLYPGGLVIVFANGHIFQIKTKK